MKKHFTPRDVELLIPKLEKIFEHIDSCRHRMGILVVQRGGGVPPATAPGTAPHSLVRLQVEFLLEAVQDNVDHIATLGGVTQDLDAGLVDFPGQMDGEEVWLSWKRGEKRVRFWRSLDQGTEELQPLLQNSSTMSH